MRERRVKKPKFKPVVTRVKLNPEQAVLQCSCFDGGQYFEPLNPGNPTDNFICTVSGKSHLQTDAYAGTTAAS